VKLLRGKDAFIIGKTNLDEFGMGSHSTYSFFGSVHNDLPFNRLSVGGSSGGSAVAVATGQCHAALGTDTGGSVRLPAAYTGIVGFKPSYGLVSRWGVVPYANSLDTVGVLGVSARTVYNAMIYLRQHDHRDPTSLKLTAWKRMRDRRKEIAFESGRHGHFAEDFSSLRIGVPIEYNIAELEPGVKKAWEDALKGFQDNGCTIVPVSLPNTKHALSAYYVLAPAEAASNLAKYDGVRYGNRSGSSDGAGDVLYSKTRGEGFGEEVRRRILLGSYTLSSEAIDNYFIKAQRVRRLVQRDFDRVFSTPNLLRPEEQFDLSDMDESIELDSKLGPSQVDFIVCPTAPTPPPTLEDVAEQTPVDTYMNDIFTVPASLAGLPAISIPWKISEEYLKSDTPAFTGIQIIGQYSDDFRVIMTAAALEQIHLGKKLKAPATVNQLDLGKKLEVDDDGVPIKEVNVGTDQDLMWGSRLFPDLPMLNEVAENFYRTNLSARRPSAKPPRIRKVRLGSDKIKFVPEKLRKGLTKSENKTRERHAFKEIDS
jgi:aspartyl-tRNA(Asn)/glutamyl-tRNA(Gln) amidotransferase subunit A